MSFIKRTLFSFTCLVALLMPTLLHAQTAMDDLKPEEYFDFWIGRWDLSWEAPDGSMETGTNHIEKILGGTVIQENFQATSGRFKGYEGKSMSVYQKQSGTWKQTWVDNNSGYIDLVGKTDGDKRIFSTESTTPEGQKMLKRMVFYDITPNSFSWDWESSVDDGKTWKLQWRIHYKRSKMSE